MNNKSCEHCNKLLVGRQQRKFCSVGCAARFNLKTKVNLTVGARKKISDSLKKRRKSNPELFPMGASHSVAVGNATKGMYNENITSILQVSKRTTSKILKRLNIGCCVCGWKESSCDIHHINGKKVNNPDGHWNLTILCPNHHRMYHNKLLGINDIKPLVEYLPSNWTDLYYG